MTPRVTIAASNLLAALGQSGVVINATHDLQENVAEAIESLHIALQDTDLRKPAVTEFPECSGDPGSCPENEGHGCCDQLCALRMHRLVADDTLAASTQSLAQYRQVLQRAISRDFQPSHIEHLG